MHWTIFSNRWTQIVMLTFCGGHFVFLCNFPSVCGHFGWFCLFVCLCSQTSRVPGPVPSRPVGSFTLDSITQFSFRLWLCRLFISVISWVLVCSYHAICCPQQLNILHVVCFSVSSSLCVKLFFKSIKRSRRGLKHHNSIQQRDQNIRYTLAVAASSQKVTSTEGL